MKGILKTIADAPYKLGAAATVALMTASGAAHAGGPGKGVAVIADNVDGQFGSLGNLVVRGSFLAGIFFAAAGLFKLKAAADSQGQQTKWSDGLWRLGLGGALMSVMFISKTSQDTIGGNSAGFSMP